MKRQLKLIILCEGARDQSFLQGYFRKQGYEFHQFRFVLCPKDNGGSGEQYVRSQFRGYLENVRAYNAKNTAGNRWLIVHTDADLLSPEQRISTLNAEATITPQDNVCMVVPKRHTETWVYHIIHDTSVSEDTDYKNRVSNDEVKLAGGMLFGYGHCRPDTPHSLNLAIKDLQKIT